MVRREIRGPGGAHGIDPERPSAYLPAARRPIAQGFRATANLAVRVCVRCGIHPDAVSYASIIAAGGAAAGLLFSQRWTWLLLAAPLLCYLRLWLNMLDGMVALASGKASRRGEIVNELPDRVSDVLIFAAIAHSGWCALWPLGYWAAILAVGTAYVGMLGQAVAGRREFGGIMAKPARMVMVHLGAWGTYAMILWRGDGAMRAGGLALMDWMCVLVIAGCAQTIWARLWRTLRLLKEQEWVARTDAKAAGAAADANGGERQGGNNGSANFERPLIDPDIGDGSVAKTFTTWDGAELFYRAWLPAGDVKVSKAVMLFHRGHEHSGRWRETVERLNLGNDCAVFAWDQRGHGHSPGQRGAAPSVMALVKDADAWARHLIQEHGVDLKETVAIAHSVGAVVALAWAHDFAPPLRGMVLATPALDVKLYVPMAIPMLRLKQKMLGPGFIKSYVKAGMLTHDPAQRAAYQADPLIFRQIAVNLLLDLFDTSKRLLADAGAVRIPTLILAAGKDWVVKSGAQWKLFDRLSSPLKQMEVYPALGHALFHETDRGAVAERIGRFIGECFARPVESDGDLVRADEGGYTRSEFDRLRSPGGFKWKLARGFLKTIGRLSQGVRIGWKFGFDSGVMLDYVYANRSRGRLLLGKIIDRNFLNAIGWRGIRIRRMNLESALVRAMEDLHQRGEPIRIADIASGPGRYVLETMVKLRGRGIEASALLRDYKPENLDAARQLARELNLEDGVKFELGDAFDRQALGAIRPAPNIAIVSGLYELFAENGPVRNSLAGLADAVAPGGYLLYTCQPWHPQVEMIARTLTNREGRPWIMRRRTQAEMDALVRQAGFEKVGQEVDEWGIFTVGVARRATSIVSH